VEKAITNLKGAGALDVKRLHEMDLTELSKLIRPAGYFNVKAKRLKAVIGFMMNHYRGDIGMMGQEKTDILREALLAVYGIGPETADSILLYALRKPVFVIDAYTKRVLSRHCIVDHDASYEACQGLFHSMLGRDAVFYNEFHALFVRVGKTLCRPTPLCGECPLRSL
jgi:endonuclease III related protein